MRTDGTDRYPWIIYENTPGYGRVYFMIRNYILTMNSGDP